MIAWILLAAGLAAAGPGVDTAPAGSDPMTLYGERCAECHNGTMPRAPHVVTFQLLGADAIHETLTMGVMKPYGDLLAAEEKVALAEALGGGPLSTGEIPQPSRCGEDRAMELGDGPLVNGWGFGDDNARHLPAELAGLPAEAVPKLELKWVFPYPRATRARSQPTFAGNTLFMGSQHGHVYAVDLETACLHWGFEADAEVRVSPTIGSWGEDGPRLYFGDLSGHVYALDARTGRLLWKVRSDAHPDVISTGAPRLHEDTLYVPMSSNEWASAADPGYPCCTFRGGIVALDVETGLMRWKTYTIPEAPKPTGARNAAGAPRWHPAGVPVWNSPTIDAKRNRLYVGTGEAYTSPAGPTSDSILALDLDTGEIEWVYQAIEGDAWNMACMLEDRSNCPEEDGPDLDFGAPPILVDLGDGEEILVAGQKAGVVHGIDPDDGRLIWKRRTGRGGFAGGVHWGMAAAGRTVFVPNADTNFINKWPGEPRPGLYALNAADGEIRWFTPAPADGCEATQRPACDPGLSAAVTSIPGVVFAGGFDGHLRAYDARTGKILWDYDTVRDFETGTGIPAFGGSIESDGPVVYRGHVLINSGYLFGGRMPGNVLLAFTVGGDE